MTVNPEDALPVEERLVRISGRAQAYPRWLSETSSRDERVLARLTDELIYKDVPWLMDQVRDLSQIRCECGWRGIGNHYHDKRMGRQPVDVVQEAYAPRPDSEPPTIDARRLGMQLIVDCPYCGRQHHHGAVGPKVGDGDGHRVSECRGHNSGYIIREKGV